jgi:hypothetical protein
MAIISPSGWREMEVLGAAAREIETLAVLEKGLPEEYHVFHGVHWTNAEKGYSVYGEIDFIIVAPNGRTLLIEQKSGFLTETPDGLVKAYRGQEKNVQTQILRSIAALLRQFGKGGDPLSIDYLLYCPDYVVQRPHSAGIDPKHIVDARRRDELVQVVQEILPMTDATAHLGKVLRFFEGTLSLVPDPSAMIGEAAQLVTRLSGGLATWARRLEFAPFRLRVEATAGSGKTQLAIAEYSATVASGLRPLYVCFNRPLADHVQRLVPAGGRVATFHMLCDEFARAMGAVPDYSSAAVWSELEQVMAKAEVPGAWLYDAVIVDEGQDFNEFWRDCVMRLLRTGGRALWLEDQMQNLYGKPPVELPDWVVLKSGVNYRSPRQIVEMLRGLDEASSGIEAGSPFLGADIEIFTYAHEHIQGMYDATKRAITACLGASFTRRDIAIVSFKGRDRSALLHLDSLGPHTLRSFSGDYDLFGIPVHREGELLAESVYRFKGQSAAAVIFTEIDFEEFDERTVRKLFVGMTRARMKLVLVLSERAAGRLLTTLD